MFGIRKSKTRKTIPGVDPQLLIRDAAKLLPDPTRRLLLRGGASLGALAFLAGCDIVDESTAENRPAEDFLFQRPGAGLAVRSQPARPDLSGQHGDAAVSVQRLLSGGRGAGGRQGRLRVRGRRPGRRQEDRGRSTSSMRCRRKPRSPATSASRAGARSANGPARRCASSCAGSAPTRGRNMSGSAAPRAIPPRSTWRPRCIRRPR